LQENNRKKKNYNQPNQLSNISDDDNRILDIYRSLFMP